MATKNHKAVDISGKRFGRLVAIRPTGEIRDHSAVWVFRCDCGNEIECRAEAVMWGGKQSCGCLAIEQDKKNLKPGSAFAYGTCPGRLNAKAPRSNTSGRRGVTWHKKSGMWVARIQLQGKMYSLGYRSDFEEACKLREEAEKRLYDNFLDWLSTVDK